MNIQWKAGALDDFKQIASWYYNDRSRKAGEKFVSNVLHCINLLKQNPLIGHIEEFPGQKLSHHRSFIIHPYYKIVYTINLNNDTLMICAIWDCRQNDKKFLKAIKR